MKENNTDKIIELEQVRCEFCNALAFKAKIKNGWVEILCRRCKKLNYYHFDDKNFKELLDNRGV